MREIETRLGRVAGLCDDGVLAFLGLPYAAAPVGSLRFAAPAEPQPWTGTRDATRFAPAAPQATGMIGALFGERDMSRSEDCLYLNVWTPGVGGPRRPVLVWIHGGGFVHGSGSQPLYDGSLLARRGDAVVVTINYRLGALGFLDPSSLDLPGAVTNAGLRDQVAALRWVRSHIGAFGGDPDNVTVFGESAGAMSISCLLAMPDAEGLFRRAILQSGALYFPQPREVAARVTHALLGECGLDRLRSACLRALPVETILQAQREVLAKPPEDVDALPFQPVVDGDLLERSPLDAIRNGSARGVAVLSGTNLDEWRLFGLADPAVRRLDLAGLVRRVTRALDRRVPDAEQAAQRVIEAYRRSRAGCGPAAIGPNGCSGLTPTELWFAIQSDHVFRVPSIRLTEAQAPHAPAYKYLFRWQSPALRGALGACHGLEIPFVFGTTRTQGLRRFVGEGAEVDALSCLMQRAWLEFARTGEPGHEQLESWPAYGTKRSTMVFDDVCRVEADPMHVERRCWDELI